MSFDLIEFARELIDIDSTTGKEPEAGAWLAARFRSLGFTVEEQRLDRGCINVIATDGPPAVVFSTHYDCVPPFFPSRVDGGRLYGRGACDAKGILAAQVAAVLRLREQGERRVGLLVVAGEERGSDGAMAANTIPGGSQFLVNGEPTESRVGAATRGVLRVKLIASGRAAHSSTPERGESAIDKLIDALVRVRGMELPADAELGRTFYSIGLIDGGIAPNVVAPHASAELMFRTVGPPEPILDRLAGLAPLVSVQEILRVPVVRLMTVPGIQSEVFPFTTDIPFLDRWGTPLLFGPGSVLVAHTADEHVEIDELLRAVETNERLARACLERVAAGVPA
jgi:acetylornithine deacetylase